MSTENLLALAQALGYAGMTTPFLEAMRQTPYALVGKAIKAGLDPAVAVRGRQEFAALIKRHGPFVPVRK